MVAAAHREWRGSSGLCSLWQGQGLRERHGDVGEGQWGLDDGSASEGGAHGTGCSWRCHGPNLLEFKGCLDSTVRHRV